MRHLIHLKATSIENNNLMFACKYISEFQYRKVPYNTVPHNIVQIKHRLELNQDEPVVCYLNE